MIRVDSNLFHISTEHSSYIMRVLDTGQLENVHYGARIDDVTGLEYVPESFDMNIGTVPYLDEDHPHHFLARFMPEYPPSGSGDTREGALSVSYGDGLSMLSLLYDGCRVFRGKDHSFPSNALSDDSTETLEITLRDPVLPVSVKLFYTVYPGCDVILRSAIIENGTGETVKLRNAASLSVDFPYDDFTLVSFDGAWARERTENRRKLLPGIAVIDSKLGISSNEHSPLVFLERESGEAYGFNLIYSGNHRETVDVSPFGKTRIMAGINPEGFEWTLLPGESFAVPEAVMTYSGKGIDEASLSFHRFVNEYIIRGFWKGRERPVLINSWEASYFDFTEESLLSLAGKASELGFELFVLDDGWFGTRRNDRKGLGDWKVNRDLFPHGLKGFSEKLREKGLMFGLWVEPEMVNMDSDLFRAHPDWAVMIPGRPPLMCRHQLVLDMTREDVREYLYRTLSGVFEEGHVDYVKWDMNRTITDVFSSGGGCRGMGEFLHRYILGLYDLLRRITDRFPEILFESCASGGNRYDLGMLAFMPQTWTSDNTDLFHRLSIQQGTLRGFPPSTMGAHVSASPGHQSLRTSLIESRFSVAAFGVLGYELDLTALSESDQEAVRNEISFYKKYRRVFQYGGFRPLRSLSSDEVWWSVTLGGTTIVLEYIKRNNPNTGRCNRLVVPFLSSDRCYRVHVRKEIIPRAFLGDLYEGYGKEESEEFEAVVSGSILSSCGISLPPQFTGNGFFPSTRVIGDNGTRLYIIEEA